MVYHRWGRVGAAGKDKLLPFPKRGRAIYEFERKFQDKTSNRWSNRKNFKPYANKYTWLETDYGETEKETVSFYLELLVFSLVPCGLNHLFLLFFIEQD
jgi:poly [ADP-ribose] polymerase